MQVTPSSAETQGNSRGLKKYTGYTHDTRPKVVMNVTGPSDEPYWNPDGQ